LLFEIFAFPAASIQPACCTFVCGAVQLQERLYNVAVFVLDTISEMVISTHPNKKHE
jgi:hypothetical protein